MSTIPVNGMIVPDGYAGMVIPEEMIDGEWRFCAGYRFFRGEDGSLCLQFATEADLESITSPETQP